jgi:membrane protease YdiL (CAAX protease family)
MEVMTPPPLPASRPVNRWRWALHLFLVTAYLGVVAAVSLGRNRPQRPALSHTAGGLLFVCAIELLIFAAILALALLASKASVDELRLRWSGKALPVVLGFGYSAALRLALLAVAVVVAGILVACGVFTPDSLADVFRRNRPGVENVVDVDAMRANPAYFWLTLTLVSFVVGGLREELWRSSFLAGMKALWPRQFGSTMGQVWAVCVAAVIFGLGHLSMGALAAVMAGLLGLGLGLIMVLHRSIWPAVLAHGFFDATSLAALPAAMQLLKHLPAQ